jgi:hypothetical protein
VVVSTAFLNGLDGDNNNLKISFPFSSFDTALRTVIPYFKQHKKTINEEIKDWLATLYDGPTPGTPFNPATDLIAYSRDWDQSPLMVFDGDEPWMLSNVPYHAGLIKTRTYDLLAWSWEGLCIDELGMTASDLISPSDNFYFDFNDSTIQRWVYTRYQILCKLLYVNWGDEAINAQHQFVQTQNAQYHYHYYNQHGIKETYPGSGCICYTGICADDCVSESISDQGECSSDLFSSIDCLGGGGGSMSVPGLCTFVAFQANDSSIYTEMFDCNNVLGQSFWQYETARIAGWQDGFEGKIQYKGTARQIRRRWIKTITTDAGVDTITFEEWLNDSLPYDSLRTTSVWHDGPALNYDGTDAMGAPTISTSTETIDYCPNAIIKEVITTYSGFKSVYVYSEDFPYKGTVAEWKSDPYTNHHWLVHMLGRWTSISAETYNFVEVVP